jgi:hypothetical protein
VVSNCCPDQSPEGGAAEDGAGEATLRQKSADNDRRARATDEVVRLGSRSKPLKGESRTWLRGEINPQGKERSKPSRAWETLWADRRARTGKLAR